MDDQKYLKQTNNNERASLKEIEEQDAPWLSNSSVKTQQVYPAKGGKKELNFAKILGKKSKTSVSEYASAYQTEEKPESSEPEEKPQFAGISTRIVNVQTPRVSIGDNINLSPKIEPISSTESPSIYQPSSHDSDNSEPVLISMKMITQKR